MTGYLEEGLGGQKIEKIGKLGSGGLTRAVFSQASLLRRTASYIQFPGPGRGGRARVSRTYLQWDEVNRKLIKQCCTKGTQISQVYGSQWPWD